MVLLQKSRGVPRRRAAGVTLIELIVVVGIVALLATVAVPSYRQYTMRAHRTEAKAALLRLAANQERFYLQNNRYSLDPDVLGFVGGLSEQGVYTLAIDTAAGVTQDWIAAATPTPGGGEQRHRPDGRHRVHFVHADFGGRSDRDPVTERCERPMLVVCANCASMFPVVMFLWERSRREHVFGDSRSSRREPVPLTRNQRRLRR